MKGESNVYVISIEGQDLSKVGISDNPRKRLKQLETGSPHRMCLAQVFRVPTREMARALEGAFHKVKREHQTRGEWFALPADEAVWSMVCNLHSMLRTHLGFSREEAARAMKLAGVPADLLQCIDEIEQGRLQ